MLQSFKKKGIDVRSGVTVKGHSDAGSGQGGVGTVVSFGEDESIETDLVVVSVGRVPRVCSTGYGGTVGARGHVEVRRAVPHG